MKLEIYTDGSSRGNPGPGGLGVVMLYGTAKKEIAVGYRLTTNNRMEMQAVITALKHLNKEGLDITIYTDSSYVVNAIEKGWIYNWLRTNFKDKKNEDLWRELMALYKKHNIKFQWVKGHATNVYNNRCDTLATYAADNHPTEIDKGYEASLK